MMTVINVFLMWNDVFFSSLQALQQQRLIKKCNVFVFYWTFLILIVYNEIAYNELICVIAYQ